MIDTTDVNKLAAAYFAKRNTETLREMMLKIKEMKRHSIKFDVFHYKVEELKSFLSNVPIDELNILKSVVKDKIAFIQKMDYIQVDDQNFHLDLILELISKSTHYKFSNEKYFVELDGIIYHQMKHILYIGEKLHV